MESNMNIDPNREIAAGPGSTNPKDLLNRGSQVYDQTKQTVSQAYDRTSQAITDTYGQAMEYGRENPGKMTMIAFGVGLGLGMLIAATRRTRTRRYAEPLVNALADIALEFIGSR